MEAAIRDASCLDDEQGDNVDDAAQGADTVVSGDDVQDQSISSPTPPTPPPQQPQDLLSTSQEALDAHAALTRRVEHLEHDKMAQDLEITKLKTRSELLLLLLEEEKQWLSGIQKRNQLQ
nr:hypothetical protein [Tanacetum cinerariifolium]